MFGIIPQSIGMEYSMPHGNNRNITNPLIDRWPSSEAAERWMFVASRIESVMNTTTSTPVPAIVQSTPSDPEEVSSESPELGEVAGESPEEKRDRVRSLLTKFVQSRGLKGAEPLIHCGLEFEFHKLYGPNSHVFRQNEYEVDREEWLSGECANLYSLSNQFGNWSDLEYSVLRQFIATNDTMRVEDLSDELRELGKEYYTVLKKRATQYYETHYRGEWMSGPDSRDIREWDSISDYTDLGDDNSVRGGEIRTNGGRTIREFSRVSHVLSSNKFDVDLDTSFHIHLSVRGVEHKWGARMQAEMYAYLLSNLHRMPEIVRRRLVAEKAGVKYARFTVRNGYKYSAIFQHEECGTWEFRPFGGISEYRDMMRCLSLALDTLRHAYSVKLGITPSMLSNYGIDQIEFALDAIYDLPTPMSEAEDIESNRPGRVVRSGVSELLEGREGQGFGLEGFWYVLQKHTENVLEIEADAV